MTTPLAERLGQLLRLLLGSDQPGEVASAVSALKRTLTAAGLDHHKLAAAVEVGLAQPRPAPRPTPRPAPRRPPPPPPAPTTTFMSWRAKVYWCLDHIDHDDGREASFLRTLSQWRGAPSEKQLLWLEDIFVRLERGNSCH